MALTELIKEMEQQILEREKAGKEVTIHIETEADIQIGRGEKYLVSNCV